MKWRLAMRITSHPERQDGHRKQQKGIQASALDAKQQSSGKTEKRVGIH